MIHVSLYFPKPPFVLRVTMATQFFNYLATSLLMVPFAPLLSRTPPVGARPRHEPHADERIVTFNWDGGGRNVYVTGKSISNSVARIRPYHTLFLQVLSTIGNFSSLCNSVHPMTMTTEFAQAAISWTILRRSTGFQQALLFVLGGSSTSSSATDSGALLMAKTRRARAQKTTL